MILLSDTCIFYFSLDPSVGGKLKSLLLWELREWSSYLTDLILGDFTLFYKPFITDNPGLIHDLNKFLTPVLQNQNNMW